MPALIHAEIVGLDTLVLMAGGPGDPADIADAARRLQTLTPLFKTTDPPGALSTALSWSAVLQLQTTYGHAFTPGPRLSEWISAQIVTRTAPLPAGLPGWLTEQLPQGLVPRDYQIAGAHEIARTGRALIFDEPRTGKTITTILGLALVTESAATPEDAALPIIVVCPASVVDPWVEAFRNWAPWLTAIAWRGAPAKRRGLLHSADVYVCSYETARMDASEATTNASKAPLLVLKAKTLVVDETHYVKNHQTHRAKAVRRLAKTAESFVGLSGTPITHHPADLWPVLDCLAPGAVPSRSRWVARYCDVVHADYDEVILGLNQHTEPEFRISILGQHRRVARADVMGQLPPKVYSVRTVEMPASWRRTYDALEAEMFAELPDGGELSVMSVLAQLTRLSQLASAAADVTTTHGPEVDEITGDLKQHVTVTLKAPSWKVDALLEVLDERCGDNGGESVVSFAPSAQLMRLAGAAAVKAGYRVGYVIGGQAQTERTETIRAFQAGELDLICATTGAGGTGITLHRAGTLVFLQRPWSLVESLQAEDRAEGDMEATRGTEIIDIVARNTIDTRVRAVLRERAGQLSDLVQDPRVVAQLLGGKDSDTAASERGAA